MRREKHVSAIRTAGQPAVKITGKIGLSLNGFCDQCPLRRIEANSFLECTFRTDVIQFRRRTRAHNDAGSRDLVFLNGLFFGLRGGFGLNRLAWLRRGKRAIGHEERGSDSGNDHNSKKGSSVDHGWSLQANVDFTAP